MTRHPFDPVSAVLGVLAIAVGMLVATRGLDAFDTSGGWWMAAVAIVVGLGLIPWRGRGAPAIDGATAEVPGDGPSVRPQ
jgi:hypothetical protein